MPDKTRLGTVGSKVRLPCVARSFVAEDASSPRVIGILAEDLEQRMVGEYGVARLERIS